MINLSSLKSIESAIARVAFSVNQTKIEGLFAKHCYRILVFKFLLQILYFTFFQIVHLSPNVCRVGANAVAA